MVSCCKVGGYCSGFILLLAISAQLWLKFGDLREYNYNTTADEAASNVDLSDKVIIVTGSNTGIGKPTARVLASHGATIIMACRSQKRADKAKSDIINELVDPTNNIINFKHYTKEQLNKNINVILLDLSSFDSIKTFASTFLNKYNKLNYLILNAGVMAYPEYGETDNGLERQFGINHVGHYYLTKLLTPILIKSSSKSVISRVISVSSAAHKRTHEPLKEWIINDNNLKNESLYHGWWNYGFSKACNILFAKEYNARYGNDVDNVYAVSLHPGGIPTELGRNLNPMMLSIFKYLGAFIKLWLKTIEQGAATTIRTVSISDNEFKKYGGSYFVDCNVANEKLTAAMNNKEYPPMLWKLSETILEKNSKQKHKMLVN